MMRWLEDVSLPAIFTVSGVVIGTLLTLIGQAFMGMLQRRQERILKTFEARMQLYVQFCAHYQEACYLREDQDTIKSEISELSRKQRGTKWSEWQEHRDRLQSKSAYTEFARIHGEFKDVDFELGHLDEKLDLFDRRIRELNIRMVGAIAAANLVSTRQVRQALNTLINGMSTEGKDLKYDSAHLTQFLNVARKELKIVN